MRQGRLIYACDGGARDNVTPLLYPDSHVGQIAHFLILKGVEMLDREIVEFFRESKASVV